MSTHKSKRKKRIQRVERRRHRSILFVFVLTLFCSLGAIILAFLLTKQPSIISPSPPHVAASTNGIEGKITKELAKMNIHPEKITSHTGEVEIQLGKNQIVIISPNRDIKSQLASLQVITTRLTMEGKRFSRLDLRFDKPVIRE